jgi:3-hydroxyacyl-CoA dehydrogenase
MLASGATSFYKIEAGKRLYYDVPTKTYKVLPGGDAFIVFQ